MKYCLVLAALLLAACSSKDDVFDKSPSQRSSREYYSLESRTCECALWLAGTPIFPKPTRCCSPIRRN